MEKWEIGLEKIREILEISAREHAEWKREHAENMREHDERMREHAENMREHAENMKERDKSMKEHDERMKKLDAEIKDLIAEREIRKIELDALAEKTLRGIAELRAETKGISDSNGMFSEEYFYNTLFNNMRFAGIDFDEIQNSFSRAKKMPDGKKIKGEYDVVMYNGDSIAIIEIKYRARKGDSDDLICRKLSNFKKLFPQYEKYHFYLGLAGLAFDEGAEDDAKQRGVGILRPKGESIEIIDEHVRAF